MIAGQTSVASTVSVKPQRVTCSMAGTRAAVAAVVAPQSVLPSSHGPYCGGSLFSWEVSEDKQSTSNCKAGEIEFVDRLHFDKMRARFTDMVETFPRFGRNQRYLFQGPPSKVVGDGTGAVLFNEPLETAMAQKLLCVTAVCCGI